MLKLKISSDPKSHRQLMVGLCSLANFINAADRIIMPLAIVPMADQLGWSLHSQGWVLGAFATGYIASQALMVAGGSGSMAYIEARLGVRAVMALAVALWSLSTLATPFVASSSLPMVLACRLLLGLGEGFGLPMIFHIFGHQVPAEERSRAFGYLVAAGTVGQALVSLVGPRLPWPWLFWGFGMLGLAWVFLWLILFREPSALPFVAYSKVGEQPGPHSLHHVRWTKLLSCWALWAIYIAHFSMNWANYVVMHWLPTYLARSLGADRSALSLTALPYLVNSICGIMSGHVADNLITRHKWPVLSVRRLMTSLGLLGPAFCLIAFYAVYSLPTALLFVSLSMGLCACNSAGHLSNHADVAPGHAGITFAISNTLATIPGILCGPLTAELVVQSQGRWLPVFVLAAGVNLAGAAVYLSQSSATPML